METPIAESELIINQDGSIYHLNIKPDDIAHDIITVGDQDRVDVVASRLDEIYITKHKREFKTVTGRIGNKSLTIISTGIGTDNIDIVFTELDALVNIDFETRIPKSKRTSLNFYRLGTTGSLRKEIEIDDIVISKYAIGLEGLMHFYNYKHLDTSCDIINRMAADGIAELLPNVKTYTVKGSEKLVDQFNALGSEGITLTASGFYGPQGRKVIGLPRHTHFLDTMAKISYEGTPVTNLEMETSGMYGMADMLGHHAISLNAILANRISQKFSSSPKTTVKKLIDGFFSIF